MSLNTRPDPASQLAGRSKQYHYYRGWPMVALILGYLLVWAGLMPGNGGINALAFAILFAEICITLVLDAQGVFSLRGRLFRGRAPWLLSAVLVLLYIPLSLLWLIPYLFVAAIDTRTGTGAPDKEAERLERIAKMEAELGLAPTPSTEGSCPHCGQPLQLGADYCAYCGEPVSPAQRICPVCHERTFADAKWCPECGASLPAP